MATVTRSSAGPFAERYQYDFKICTPAKGWAQLDTGQDASYYGNWINPFSFELLCFAEGDLDHTKCDGEEDFARTVRECIAWHKEHGHWDRYSGIDRGISNPAIAEAFERMGLGGFLH
jgi:hypothetical protein